MPRQQLSEHVHFAPPPAICVSPLMLADRLLSLAQDADRAGFFKPAERLLKLAYAVCDEKPLPQ
jgi:hypothetical protein